MKKYISKISAALGLVGLILLNSCDLDINDNPNSPTGAVVSPNFTFGAVVAATAYTQVYTLGYVCSSYIMGYQVPGGGIAGFGDVYTYNFGASFNTDAWNRSFDELRDYQAIINKAGENPEYVIYGAVANIMKVYQYQLLVDAYGDVPYSEGLQGDKTILLPKYDKAADIYQDLVKKIDEAIAAIKSSSGATGLLPFGSNNDPIFKGDLTKWIKFANNIKLRLLVRARGSAIDGFVQSAFGSFSTEGFLLEDILVNPGYNASSQQNPMWTTYHSNVAGTITQPARYFLPSTYIFSFYNGNKLDDPVRGALTYKGYPNVNTWQLGNEVDRPNSPNYIWFIGTGTGVNASSAQGLLKSRAAGYPLISLAETHFLLAEAALYGRQLNGDAKNNFVKGIEASFNYLAIEGTSAAPPADFNVAEKVAEYIEANSDNYLANFDKAATNDQKLEAIITQKYLALNLINTYEAWTEFRRTTYPRTYGTDPATTFVSPQSQSTRPDRLPVRLLYPQNENNTNKENTPAIANAFSSPIFWQKN
ncbi:MAG: SusD/RagB family nutrient-binding outer membrane lipoprotein [Tannerellaceae bacterium]|jgi:hypothetical protein|nr:SusD/RagB family nutrient-binding outer membrane lipoprotein [Tannerellaceae bacterium]